MGKLKKILQKQGFTLVELIIVIAIIAVLAVAAFMMLTKWLVNTRDSRRLSDLSIINSALSVHLLDLDNTTGLLPEPDGYVTVKFDETTTWHQGILGQTGTSILGNLNKIPVDPFGKHYVYSTTIGRKQFQIAAELEKKTAFMGDNSVYADEEVNEVEGNFNPALYKLDLTGTTCGLLYLPSIVVVSGINDMSLGSGDQYFVLDESTDNLLYGGSILKTYKDLVGVDKDLDTVWTGGCNTLFTQTIIEDIGDNLSGMVEDLPTDPADVIEEVKGLMRTGGVEVEEEPTASPSGGSGNCAPNPGYTHATYTEGSPTEVDEAWQNTNSGQACYYECEIGYIGNSCSIEVFVSTWKTDNSGESNDNQIKLPLQSNGVYNFTVYRGDGTSSVITAYNQTEVTHTYASNGTYDVSIEGEINGFSFNNTGDIKKILDIKHWGPGFRFGNNGGYFYGCYNLSGFSAVDVPNLTGTTDLTYMFKKAHTFNGNINNWDVSNVTNMRGVFTEAQNFNQPLDNWNVSNVTDMLEMFKYTRRFNQPLDNWNVSNVTNMYGMFEFSARFNQPLNNWNVSNVTNISKMFYRARNFNQPLDNWDVSNVTNMSFLFSSTKFNQDISGWDVSNVTNMRATFENAFNFNQNINNWDVSNVTLMTGMFKKAYVFNQPLDNWDVSNVIQMTGMFKNAYVFNQDISGWDVSNVTHMAAMFRDASAFNQSLNSWNVSNVTYMSEMFAGAVNFNQPLNSWNVSNVGRMEQMFDGASSFDQNISGWNVSKVQSDRHDNFDSNTSATWTASEKPNFN